MTADVDVHVDESGQKGAISQVVGHGTRALINLEYLRALNFHRRILQNPAFAVDDAGCANRDRRFLRACGRRAERRTRRAERRHENDANRAGHERRQP